MHSMVEACFIWSFVNIIFWGRHLFEYGDAVEVKSSHKVLFV